MFKSFLEDLLENFEETFLELEGGFQSNFERANQRKKSEIKQALEKECQAQILWSILNLH